MTGIIVGERRLFDPGETLVVENPKTFYGLCRSEALVVVHHDGHVIARCLLNGAHNGDILLHSGVANLGLDTCESSFRPTLGALPRVLHAVVPDRTVGTNRLLH